MAFLKVDVRCMPCLLTLGFRGGLLNVGQMDNVGLWCEPSIRLLIDMNPIARYVSLIKLLYFDN